MDDSDAGGGEQRRWPAPWFAPSQKYSMLRMKTFPVPEAWPLVSRRFSVPEVAAIAAAIRKRKMIPVLPFVREALANGMEWECKDPWWVLPHVVMAEKVAGIAVFDSNGLFGNALNGKVIEGLMQTDNIGKMIMDPSAKNSTDPNPIRRLVIELRGGGGFLTLDEFQVEGFGSHLDVLAAIWEVWGPVVERDLDSPIRVIDDSMFRSFASWDGLLAWARSAQVEESGEEADPADAEEQEAEPEDAASGGLPSFVLRNAAASRARAAHYPGDWLQPTEEYDGRPGLSLAVPEGIGELVGGARHLSAAEVEGLAGRIREHKLIPQLEFLPSALDAIGNPWWFHPLIVIAERTVSWLAANRDGLSFAISGDDDCRIGISWSRSQFFEVVQLEPRLWRATVEADNGEECFLSEFVPLGCGSQLAILEAIWDVYEPVVVASRGWHSWRIGAGDEAYKAFSSWEELLNPVGWEDGVMRIPRGLYG